MNKTHTIPHIYDPEIPYSAKCEIMEDLCQSLAKYKGMTEAELRLYLLKKLSVDIEKLESNPVGLLLLYEYLYSQRPEACLRSEKIHVTDDDAISGSSSYPANDLGVNRKS